MQGVKVAIRKGRDQMGEIENTSFPEDSEIDTYIELLKEKLLPAYYVTHG